MVDAEYYRSLVEPILREPPLDHPHGCRGRRDRHRQLPGDIGAPRPFVLAGSPGTGELPDPDLAETGHPVVHQRHDHGRVPGVLGCRSPTSLRTCRDQIDDWDPDHRPWHWPPASTPTMDIHGRPTWAGRPAAWEAIEDKTDDRCAVG